MIKGSINNIIISKSNIQCNMILSRFNGEADTTSPIFKDFIPYVRIIVTRFTISTYSVRFCSMNNNNLLVFHVNIIKGSSTLTDEKINNSYFGRMVYETFMNKVFPILVEELNNYYYLKT